MWARQSSLFVAREARDIAGNLQLTCGGSPCWGVPSMKAIFHSWTCSRPKVTFIQRVAQWAASSDYSQLNSNHDKSDTTEFILLWGLFIWGMKASMRKSKSLRTLPMTLTVLQMEHCLWDHRSVISLLTYNATYWWIMNKFTTYLWSVLILGTFTYSKTPDGMCSGTRRSNLASCGISLLYFSDKVYIFLELLFRENDLCYQIFQHLQAGTLLVPSSWKSTWSSLITLFSGDFAMKPPPCKTRCTHYLQK